MGMMQLSEFREELIAVLGTRIDIDAPRVDRWVNFGYLDVTGSVEFEELEEERDYVVNATEDSTVLEADVRSVLGVRSSLGMLQWMPRYEWLRMKGISGVALKWTRVGSAIKVSPASTTGITLNAIVKTESARLTDDTDTSVIPQTWDMAIHYMAVSHAFFAVDETSNGVVWFNRAVAYMKTRANDEGRKMVDPAIGGLAPPSPARLGVVMSETSSSFPGGQ